MNSSELSTNINSSFKISNFLSTESKEALVRDIYKGLSAKQKYISSRFFYDDIGSALFEEITGLPEYYPTRTEISILNANAKAIVSNFEQFNIIELGSGDCTKISIVLDAIPKNKIKSINYVPIDVSEAAIFKSADILALKYSGIKIHGLLADFLKHLEELPGEGQRLICFFGSTLGNLNSSQSTEFLLNLKQLMNPNDKFLLGLDMLKDSAVIKNAYNDKQGITTQFNKNILNVVNGIIEADFNVNDFEHHAPYNERETRIEMYLKAKKDLVITSVLLPEKIHIKAGETIHTENSRKYSLTDIEKMEAQTGFKTECIYTDKNKWFSLVQFS